MLRLFGHPHYHGGDGVIPGLPEKAFVLIAALVFEKGHATTRERARTLLWEDASSAPAAENLRWLLSRIRKWQLEHGAEIVTIGRAELALSLDAQVDAAQLLGLEGPGTAKDLEALVELYRGELLAGLEADAAPLLNEHLRQWRDIARRHYLGLVRAAAVRIGGAASERVLRQLVAEEGDDEDLARALLVRVATDKGATAARAVYESIARRLRDEFGTAPSVETRALFAQLMPDAGIAAAPAPPTAAPEVEDGGIPRIVLLPPEAPVPVGARTALLADAMVEDVCLQLCRMRTFAMFAPHTARRVAGLEPAAAVLPLGVRYVARTMLMPRAAGDGLRLSLSLVQVASGAIVFADQFDFDRARIGAHFAELAEAIAGQLATAIERVEIAAYRRTGAASAYVQYLLGTKVVDAHDLKRLRRARHHFARALELEPNYVPAMTAIARTLTKETLALRRTGSELLVKAMSLAEQAAERDPLDPNAWREKAAASLYMRDIDASLHYLDAALSRARHHADIIAEKAEVLVHASRPLEARQHMSEAMALNPIAPDDYHWTLGSAEFFLGRYEPAVTALRKMRNTDSASRLIAAAAAMSGDTRTAAVYRERWMQIYPDSSIDAFPQFMPHANKADVAHYVEALRRAGFS